MIKQHFGTKLQSKRDISNGVEKSWIKFTRKLDNSKRNTQIIKNGKVIIKNMKIRRRFYCEICEIKILKLKFIDFIYNLIKLYLNKNDG